MGKPSRILGSLCLALLVLACRGAPPTADVALVPEATVMALAAENAQLAATVTALHALAEELARCETAEAAHATPTAPPEAPGAEGSATPQPSGTEAAQAHVPTASPAAPTEGDTTLYTSSAYGVSLRYPADWASVAGYDERFAGEDGFVQLGAVGGAGLSLAEICALEYDHVLQPYGSKPSVQTLSVSDREACLVRPSADQPREMERQAVVLLAYSEPRAIGGGSYQYLVLWADTDHILQIAASLELLE